MKILVVAEQRSGELSPSSLEAVAAGQQLAAESDATLVIALAGANLDAAVAQLAKLKAEELVLITDAALEPYRAEAYVRATRALLDDLSPQLVLFPHTYLVCDYAPRVAAAYSRILINDCIGYRREAEETVFVRQVFRSRLNADLRASGDTPVFVSLQAGAFRSDAVVEGEEALPTRQIDAGLDGVQWQTTAHVAQQEAAGDIDIGKADIIVSLGRGIQSEDNIPLAEQLAALLNAELGSSRPLVDAGWMPKARQVGSSGNIVSPKLYLALGISGASQHMVGARGARSIIAINKDANAPIFAAAEYGIVGDVMEIVPALIDALQK